MVSNKSNIQTTFPTEVVLVNKFLNAKAIEWIQPLNYKKYKKNIVSEQKWVSC